MKLFNLIKNFRNDEDGAVTVDWVVLTAAIVGLGIVVMNTVGGGITTSAKNLTSNLNSAVSGSKSAGTTYQNGTSGSGSN